MMRLSGPVRAAVGSVIDNNVDIGPRAKPLRPIQVGDSVVSRANAVVLSDVPNNSAAVGVPAVVKQRRVGQEHVDAIQSKFGRQVS